jgi:hypothetical protein
MSYHYFEIYPSSEDREDRTPYFIEFLQFFEKDPITWKLYLRHFFHTPEEMAKIKEKGPNEFLMASLSNEGHPWWLLDGKLQPDGTVPDKKWLLWMVDALNEKAHNDHVKSINCSGGE